MAEEKQRALKSQFLLLRKIGRRYHQVIKLAMKGFPVNAWLAFIRMLANQAILVMDKGIMEKNLWYSAQRKNYQQKKSGPSVYVGCTLQ